MTDTSAVEREATALRGWLERDQEIVGHAIPNRAARFFDEHLPALTTHARMVEAKLKRVRAELDLLRAQKAELLALCDHTDATPEDLGCVTTRQVRGILAREGGAEAPQVTPTCGRPDCHAERKLTTIEHHSRECCIAESVARFNRTHAADFDYDVEPDGTANPPGSAVDGLAGSGEGLGQGETAERILVAGNRIDDVAGDGA